MKREETHNPFQGFDDFFSGYSAQAASAASPESAEQVSQAAPAADDELAALVAQAEQAAPAADDELAAGAANCPRCNPGALGIDRREPAADSSENPPEPKIGPPEYEQDPDEKPKNLLAWATTLAEDGTEVTEYMGIPAAADLPDSRKIASPAGLNRGKKWAWILRNFDPVVSGYLEGLVPGWSWEDNPKLARAFYRRRQSGTIDPLRYLIVALHWENIGYNHGRPDIARLVMDAEYAKQAFAQAVRQLYELGATLHSKLEREHFYKLPKVSRAILLRNKGLEDTATKLALYHGLLKEVVSRWGTEAGLFSGWDETGPYELDAYGCWLKEIDRHKSRSPGFQFVATDFELLPSCHECV